MQPGKRQHGRIVIPLLVCALLIGCREKQAAPDYSVRNEFGTGPLRVLVELPGDRILLSELLPVRITVTGPAGIQIQWPDPAGEGGDFRIRDWEDGGRRLLSDGTVEFVRRYRLEPMKTGDLQIPPLAFPWTSGADSDSSTLTTEAIAVTAAAALREDLSEVSIGDIEDVVEMKGHAAWLWLTAAAAAVLAAAAIGIFRRRRKQALQAPKIYKPAHEIALARIRDLAGQNLIEQGRVREFYERLSNTLRHYIENRFSLRAPERTTEEFLDELKSSSVLAPDHKQELRAFLEHSDLVKFARHEPTRQQSDQSLQMAERFVENTKSEDRLVEVGPDGQGA